VIGHRRAKPEEAFQRAVMKYARLKGWRTAHFRPAQTRSGSWVTAVAGDGMGFPDLVLVRERVIVAELKAGKNKVSPEQKRWLQAFEKAGIAAYTWYPYEWDEIEQVLS